MRARIVKLSVDSATLHHWVVLYSAGIKAISVQVRTGLLGLQDVEALRFPDTLHMKVVRLSRPCTGRIPP